MWLKRLINRINQQRVYSGWTKPQFFDRNLIVIGAGAAGLVSSYIAATVKAKVTLIEKHKMGGDCLNYGCVPSKAIIKSAKIAETLRHAHHYGFTVAAIDISFKQVMQRVQQVIQRIEPHDSIERYSQLGVDVKSGHTTIIDPWTVEIRQANGDTERLTTRNILLATGAQPFVPPLPGLDQVDYVTSDTLWQRFTQLKQTPKQLVILGGGPIGCELAHCFARLGSQVIQVEQQPHLMQREDIEVSQLVEQQLMASGVKILTHHTALRCELRGKQKWIVLKHQQQEIDIEFDQLIIAVGRQARLQGYGLEKLGINTEQALTSNDYLQTRYPNIYAAGDIIGPYQFTHVAAHQAWYVTINALFGQFKRFKVDYRVTPWTTFIDPEVARVGLNEAQAQQQGIDYEVTRFDFAELDRAITDSAELQQNQGGFIKIITPKGKDRILDVTIIAPNAGDLLAEFVLAMKHNLGLNKILATIHSYPTWAEGNKYLAGKWKRNHAPLRVLSWLEKYHHWQRQK